MAEQPTVRRRVKRRRRGQPKKWIIYTIVCRKAGKHFRMRYVGQTNDFTRRCGEYRTGRGHGRIGKAIRELGHEHFDITPLEEVPEWAVNEAERYWIEHYDCIHPKGFNTLNVTGGLRKTKT